MLCWPVSNHDSMSPTCIYALFCFSFWLTRYETCANTMEQFTVEFSVCWRPFTTYRFSSYDILLSTYCANTFILWYIFCVQNNICPEYNNCIVLKDLTINIIIKNSKLQAMSCIKHVNDQTVSFKFQCSVVCFEKDKVYSATKG